MRGLKKVSPLETRIGISTFWKTPNTPQYWTHTFRHYFFLKCWQVRMFYSKRYVKKRHHIKRIRKQGARCLKEGYPFFQALLWHRHFLIYRKICRSMGLKLRLQKLRHQLLVAKVFPIKTKIFYFMQWRKLKTKKSKLKIWVYQNNFRGFPFNFLNSRRQVLPQIQTTDNLLWSFGIEPSLVTAIKFKYSYLEFQKDLRYFWGSEWLQWKLRKFREKYMYVWLVYEAMITRQFTPFMLNFQKLVEKSRRHYQNIGNITTIFEVLQQANDRVAGYQFHITGTIGRHGRSRTLTIRKGTEAVSTLYRDFEYTMIQCITPYGCIGIKIWLEYFQLMPDRFYKQGAINRLITKRAETLSGINPTISVE